MAGGDKKWDVTAERDLCLAIILGNSETEKPRHNWPQVHSFMKELGYDFTKDAVSGTSKDPQSYHDLNSQHFTKAIMRDFKKRHGGAASSTPSTPKKPTPRATPRKRTPAKRKASSEEEEEEEEDEGNEPAEKKIKTDEEIKQEEKYAREARERSATIMDHDSKFRAWLKKEIKGE